MKKILTAFAVFLSVAPAVFADTAATATIIEVVDAGTLRVDYNGIEERLRLIGVVVPADTGNNGDGWSPQKASDGVRSLVSPGTVLTLEFDLEQRDMQNNLEAYAYMQDNRNMNIMLNNAVLYWGFANTKAEPPNIKYAPLFNHSCQDAMMHSRGLWQYTTN
jgi:endonuclease YncB( thermonuclease family)